jgi:hypothetical protein
MGQTESDSTGRIVRELVAVVDNLDTPTPGDTFIAEMDAFFDDEDANIIRLALAACRRELGDGHPVTGMVSEILGHRCGTASQETSGE